MTEMKINRKQHITVVQSGLCERTSSLRDPGDPIYSLYQHFTFRVMHRKGSNRPEGTFHTSWGGSERSIEVRWLRTESLGFFAPEMRFQPSDASMKLAKKVGKALMCIRHTQDEGPDALVDYLKAYVVEYINDNKPGCFDDYKVLHAPGDSAMMTIARYAS